MNSWKSRFSMLLLKWAAATFLKRAVASSARGLWDPLGPAGAGPGASGRSPTPRLGGAAARVQTARQQPVLGGLRGAGRRLGLTPRSAPHAFCLIALSLSFSLFALFPGALQAESAACGSAPGLREAPPPAAPPGLPPTCVRRTGVSAALSLLPPPATRCLSWESLKRGSQVYLLRVTPGQAIVLVGASYPIPGS